MERGRAQELESEGHNLEPSVFRPKSSEEQKKGHQALRLSFIRISLLHHKRFVHFSAGGGGGGGGAAPPWIRPCGAITITNNFMFKSKGYLYNFVL